MAAKKSSAATLPMPAPTWPLSPVFDRREKAWGARFIKKGFALTPELDVAFALGWPHAVTLVEDHPANAHVVEALERGIYYEMEWPTVVASRWARLRALGAMRGTPEGKVLFEGEGEAIAHEAGPISAADAPALMVGILGNTEWRQDLRETSRIIEAFVGPETFATAVVEALENAADEVLALDDIYRTFVVKHCAFALLRSEPATSEALRARLAKLLQRPVAKTAPRGSVIGYVDVILGGRAGFERSSRRMAGELSVHDIMHVYDDPEYVREMVQKQHPNFMLPDARLLFLGGADLAQVYLDKFQKLKGQHERIVREFGAVRSPIVVEIMRKIAAAKEARADAQAWLAAYAV